MPIHVSNAHSQKQEDFLLRPPACHCFFAYVPFNAVHTPIEATEKYQKRFTNVKDETQPDYNAMTGALDDAIGSIAKALERIMTR